jgi:hypothetical protein
MNLSYEFIDILIQKTQKGRLGKLEKLEKFTICV